MIYFYFQIRSISIKHIVYCDNILGNLFVSSLCVTFLCSPFLVIFSCHHFVFPLTDSLFIYLLFSLYVILSFFSPLPAYIFLFSPLTEYLSLFSPITVYLSFYAYNFFSLSLSHSFSLYFSFSLTASLSLCLSYFCLFSISISRSLSLDLSLSHLPSYCVSMDVFVLVCSKCTLLISQAQINFTEIIYKLSINLQGALVKF